MSDNNPKFVSLGGEMPSAIAAVDSSTIIFVQQDVGGGNPPAAWVIRKQFRTHSAGEWEVVRVPASGES